MYTFGTGSNPDAGNNIYAPNVTKAIHIPSTSNSGFLSNTSYTEGWTSGTTNIDMTVSAWVKLDSVSNSTRYIFHFQNALNNNSSAIGIYAIGDKLYTALYDINSDTTTSGQRIYTVDNAFTTTQYVHLVVAMDRSDITTAPSVWLDGASQTVNAHSTPGTGTGKNSSIGKIHIGDLGVSSHSNELQGYIADISVWGGKLVQNDVNEIYNKGRWRDLFSHPKANLLYDWWQFQPGGGLPSLNKDVSVMASNEQTLQTADSSYTSIVADSSTVYSRNLTIGNIGVVKVGYGIVKEWRDVNNYYYLPNANWFVTAKDLLVANSNGAVSAAASNADSSNNFTTITGSRHPAGVFTGTPSGGGVTFTNITQFGGGSNGSGVLSSDTSTPKQEAFLNIQKKNGGGYTNATLNTTNYFRIKFFVGDGSNSNNVPSVSTAGSSFTNSDLHSSTNLAIIDVTTDYMRASDTNLWNHVLNLINNYTDTNYEANASRSNGTFTVKPNTAGLGNTNYISKNSDEGNHISNISNTGGAASTGMQDGQRIQVPFYNNAASSFQTASFEVDISTGNSAQVSSGYEPLPGRKSSEQAWQSAYTITSDTTLWNAVANIMSKYSTNKFGANYDISYTSNAGVATFTIRVKSSAPAPSYSDYDDLLLTPDSGDVSIPNTDFDKYKAPCGAVEGHYVEFNVNGTTKRFEIDSGSSGDDGNTRRVDAYGVSSPTFWNNLESAITAEIGSGFSVSFTSNQPDDDCNDYADFSIIKNQAGSYNYNITKAGNSFINQTQQGGADSFGFGHGGVGPGNRLQIGGVTVAEANASSNSGVYVSRNQSQGNIVSNIISSITNTSPGTNYNITAHPQGNGHEFRLTASAVGSANNRVITGAGQFSATGSPMGGGENDTGLGVGGTVELRLRKGNDFTSAWNTTSTAQSVRIHIQDSTQSTTLTSGYTDNNVYINVKDSALSNDGALYSRIRNAINNHGSLNMTAVVENTNELALESDQVGGGNTNFYTHAITNNIGGISRANAQGGLAISGSTVNHTLAIDGVQFKLMGDTNRGSRHIDITDVTDQDVWDELKLQINASSSFTVTSTSSVGNVATFNIESDTTGSANDSELDVVGTSPSFNVTKDTEGGTNESGAVDGDTLSLYNGTSNTLKRIIFDKDGSNSDGTTTSYVDSTATDNAAFWGNIKGRLEAFGYGVSFSENAGSSPTTARFTVQSYLFGGNGNQGSTNNVGSATSFSNVSNFANGLDDRGAVAGQKLAITGSDGTVKTFEIVHTTPSNSGNNFQIRGDSQSVDKATFWENFRASVQTNTEYNAFTASSGTPRTFEITSSGTGSAANPNLQTNNNTPYASFESLVSHAGVDESGAEDGDTITIDGHTITIDLASGLGTGSTSDFHNALSKSIKDNTDFKTIVIGNESGGYTKFHLTSSVTGTIKNVNFTKNSAGIRDTFKNLDGADGGTDTFGLQHTDYIRLEDSDETISNSSKLEFTIDATSSAPETQASSPLQRIFRIGVQDILEPNNSQTDAQRSRIAWNRLSASIKARSPFGEITIEEFIDANGGDDGQHHAIFHITSSTTGSLYNSDISTIFAASPDDGGGAPFTIVAQTAGGTDESGSTAGHKLTIGDKTFEIVHNSSPTALQINASATQPPNQTADQNYWNAMTAAIKSQTDFDMVTYTSANNTASFSLTSSLGDPNNNYAYTDPFTGESFATGSAFNVNITVDPTSNGSFRDPDGMAGGEDGDFRDIRFQEIIPQPRYNYPHTLTSPGSVRNPTAKSNLGLIDVNYKLRSNHFALTRSLGYGTDGLYDNTSRWTTPDLSGLVPFDEDYNHYYERHRGQNKHFSLVPEFRISSHVEGILNTGADETSYFAKNWWLEITGASFDHGSSVAKNYPRGSQDAKDFLLEYSTTSNIKNIDAFIEDHKPEKVGLEPVKLTLTCEAINNFLPYEGFYPQTRTVQMCEAFAKSYGKGMKATEADPNDTTLQFPDNNNLAQTRPIYDAIMSPGLLYNTIKSGIAVDYPVVLSKMATSSLKDPYGGRNYMISNEYFEDRLPFETLLSPESFMSKKFLVDMNPHPSSSMNLKAMIGNATDPNYKLMSNNFFAETMEFFLQEGRSSRITSAPESDPNFGNVTPLSDGSLPIYKAIFRVFKSKKDHPYIEFSGAADVVRLSENHNRAEDLYYNRPPSGTNYYLREYCGVTGADLEYDIKKTNYPRPNMNPYAEVETITMYSQPNAFGPPCAGGVAVEFKGRTIVNEQSVAQTGANNNTTYMMYDSTNGYNAPFTPPYYDGEAWAIYTFVPERSGKHSLNEILENTNIQFLRYELNHESGSYGDRGTFGPQGFTINDNAMQADASFNLMKKVVFMPEQSEGGGSAAGGRRVRTFSGFVPANQFDSPAAAVAPSMGGAGLCWVIESKFETPILDFSKYLNRDYNAVMESDVTTDDIYTGSISLSGTRNETPTNNAHRLETRVHPSLASVHKLSGTLNPIGMWHQYGDFPTDPDKGIFMQLIDVPPQYLQLGTEMTIPNPKWIVAKPNVIECEDNINEALDDAYNKNAKDSMLPYLPKQEIKRKMVGVDEFAVLGGAVQIINPQTGLIVDTELIDTDLKAAFNVDIDDQAGSNTTTNAVEGLKLFDIFRDKTAYPLNTLQSGGNFTSGQMKIFKRGVNKATDFPVASNSDFKGHWAASYYHYDREPTYAPLLIVAKNYEGLKYDYGDFSKGLFEDFLKDFSIGIPYRAQSAMFSDGEDVRCTRYTDGSRNPTVFAPKFFVDALERANDNLSITNLSKVNMTEESKFVIGGLIEKGIKLTNQPLNKEAKAVNNIKKSIKQNTTFKNIGISRKKFRLIPSISGLPTSLASDDTSTYGFSEPLFVRGSIRYNAGASLGSLSVSNYRAIANFSKMPQFAPQNDKNIATNPSTIRWGKFMHDDLDTKSVRSLANLVGFNQSPVKMGITSKSRRISEAVVAMPYILRDGSGTPEWVSLDPIAVMLNMFLLGLITREEAMTRLMEHLELNNSQDFSKEDTQSESTFIKKLNANASRGRVSAPLARMASALRSASTAASEAASNSSNDISARMTSTAGTSFDSAFEDIREGAQSALDPAIRDQIEKMGKYVFPPHIDFLNYDVNPLAMYIFEFSRNLNRDDLNDIWQGVRSENLKKVHMQTKSITHNLDVHSLLGSVKEANPDLTILKDIKWRIFKVKRRANTDYKEKMKKDLAAQNYFVQQEKEDSTDIKIGYNWPYDYFSMVENVKLKVDIELGQVVVEEPEQDSNYNGPDFQAEAIPEVITGITGDRSTDSAGTSYTVEPGLVNVGAGFRKPPETTEGDNELTEATFLPADTSWAFGTQPPRFLEGQATNTTAGETTTSSCVLAGTMIETKRGRVPVESITLGDAVLSYNFEKEEFDYYDVLHVMTPVLRNRWVNVKTTAGHELKCTEEHPLYSLITDNNEMPINQTKIGDSLFVYESGVITSDTIASIDIVDESVMVYNFEVQQVQSYISNNILSHNKQYETEDADIDKPAFKSGNYSYGGLFDGGGVSQEDKEEQEENEDVGSLPTPGQVQT